MTKRSAEEPFSLDGVDFSDNVLLGDVSSLDIMPGSVPPNTKRQCIRPAPNTTEGSTPLSNIEKLRKKIERIDFLAATPTFPRQIKSVCADLLSNPYLMYYLNNEEKSKEGFFSSIVICARVRPMSPQSLKTVNKHYKYSRHEISACIKDLQKIIDLLENIPSLEKKVQSRMLGETTLGKIYRRKQVLMRCADKLEACGYIHISDAREILGLQDTVLTSSQITTRYGEKKTMTVLGINSNKRKFFIRCQNVETDCLPERYELRPFGSDPCNETERCWSSCNTGLEECKLLLVRAVESVKDEIRRAERKKAKRTESLEDLIQMTDIIQPSVLPPLVDGIDPVLGAAPPPVLPPLVDGIDPVLGAAPPPVLHPRLRVEENLQKIERRKQMLARYVGKLEKLGYENIGHSFTMEASDGYSLFQVINQNNQKAINIFGIHSNERKFFVRFEAVESCYLQRPFDLLSSATDASEVLRLEQCWNAYNQRLVEYKDFLVSAIESLKKEVRTVREIAKMIKRSKDLLQMADAIRPGANGVDPTVLGVVPAPVLRPDHQLPAVDKKTTQKPKLKRAKLLRKYYSLRGQIKSQRKCIAGLFKQLSRYNFISKVSVPEPLDFPIEIQKKPAKQTNFSSLTREEIHEHKRLKNREHSKRYREKVRIRAKLLPVMEERIRVLNACISSLEEELKLAQSGKFSAGLFSLPQLAVTELQEASDDYSSSFGQ